jgi:hypothetical protein
MDQAHHVALHAHHARCRAWPLNRGNSPRLPGNGNALDERPADFDPYIFSMVGNAVALIIFSVFGVVTTTREYSSGMIQVTLSALPDRGGVLFAKVLLVTLIIFVFGLATTVGMFLVGQAALGATGLPVVSHADRDARHMVIGPGAVMDPTHSV